MKKLLIIAVILAACGCTTSVNYSEAEKKAIIGTPKKLGNIEIAQHDFPDHMKWNDAKTTCNKLGDRWRLPTKDELKDMFLNKDEIGGFSSEELDYYWSSTKYYGYLAWYQDFNDGSQDGFNKSFKFRVRAVRSF